MEHLENVYQVDQGGAGENLDHSHKVKIVK